MMNFFRKPTGDDLKRQQLEESKRCAAIYSAEREHMAAMETMHLERIARLETELSSKGEA